MYRGLIYFRYFFSLFGDCNKHVVAEKLSPDKAYLAQELYVGCGATTPNLTQMFIKNLKTGSEKVVLSIKNDLTKSCNMNWDGDTSLKLSCNENIEQIYVQENAFEGIKLFYDFSK